MYLLASQILCNIATDTGIPGMCLCYQQFKHPAETAVGWREMSFCDSKLVCWLLAWGWKSWVWRMNTQSKRKRGQGGRNKGTPNKGLVKRRGDGPRCNACRKKKAPCHMKFTVNVHTVQAHLRFLKWMRRILHQKFSLPNQFHQTQNDQHLKDILMKKATPTPRNKVNIVLPKRQRIEVLFLLLILVACDAGA